MNVAGIDYSTRAVDIVTVSYDGDGPPTWHRFELVARGELDDPFERTRDVRPQMPRFGAFWDEIVAVGIEHPGGRYGIGDMLRVQGAILSCIPSHLQVEPWPPAKWRKAVGLPGNASKHEVALNVCGELGHFDYRRHPDGEMKVPDLQWPQDAYDAYCIAVATRQAITTTQAA